MLGKVSGTSLDCSPVSGLVWSNNIYPNPNGTLTYDLSAPNHSVSISNASFEFVEILNLDMQSIFIMFLNELVATYPFIKILGINTSPENTYHFEAKPDGNGNYLLYSQNGDFESDPITLTLKAALSNPIDDLYPHLGGESLPSQMSIHTCGLNEILA
ncbi:MAG: hypothetical protein O2793_16240 [Proteobacteria bacterium]|nr:hypothetical protein [Pseudomonadota bacterium]MDA1255928.1 hypothetical protein [Pseudomonadota bacterium]